MEIKMYSKYRLDARYRRLKFEKDIETAFRQDYFIKSLSTSRIAIILTIFLYSAFGVLDTWSAPMTKEYIWLIRYAIVLPVLVITLWVTYTPLFRKAMQLVLSLLALILGFGIVAMIAITHVEEAGYATYYAGMMLVSMACYTFLGLRLFNAVAVNMLLIIGYEIVVVFMQDMLSTKEGLLTFINNNFFFITTNIIGIAAGYFLELYHRKDFIQQKIIETEKNKTQSLLHNILPSEIAETLKSQPRVIANYHEQVSILFADVVNFTPLSEKLDPKDLVDMLNDLFSRFDTLVDRHGVEKIKTIGDCYMVAAGIPSPRSDHAQVLAEIGIEMLESTSSWTTKFGNKLDIRIGINSGPVVAGVIGHKKFAYDLWGDTVNLASRMESHGIPGKVQVTKSSYELLRNDFILEEVGEVMIKGKGAIPVWRIIGKKGPSPG